MFLFFFFQFDFEASVDKKVRITHAKNPRFHFFISLFFFFLLFLIDIFQFFIAGIESELNCGCFVRSRRSVDMCPDDMGKDCWDWFGPPTGKRERFNSPEWVGRSSRRKRIAASRFLVRATHHPQAILTQHLLSVCTPDVTSTVMTHMHIHHECCRAHCLVRV